MTIHFKGQTVRVFDGPTFASLAPSIRLELQLDIAAPPVRFNFAAFALAASLPLSSGVTEMAARSQIGEAQGLAEEAAWVAAALLHATGTPAQRVQSSIEARGAAAATLTLVYDYQERNIGLKCAMPIADLLKAAIGDDQAQARKVLTDHNARLGLRLGEVRHIQSAALRRGIAVTELVQNVQVLLLLGSGERQRRVQATITDRTSQIGHQIANNKAVANAILTRQGLPVARQGVAPTVAHAQGLAKQIGYPVVVKPATAGRGFGVTANIRTAAEVHEAFEAAVRHGPVVVEKHIEGDDHRLTVFDGVMKSAIRRKPAQVIGDGRSTVRQLIEAENRRRAANRAVGKTSHDLKIAPETDRILARQNLTMDSAPKQDLPVPLRSVANIAQGGTAEDVTHQIHPQNRVAAERAARALGLDVTGVDFLTTDISRSYFEIGGAICELNTNPGVIFADVEVGVLDAYLDHLAPGDADLSIPLFAVLGSSSTELVARLGTRLSQNAGPVGVASRRGATIGDAAVMPRGGDNKAGARILLEDPTTAVAVVEINAANVAAEGLGFDRCRCVAITDLHNPDGERPVIEASAKLLLQLCRSFAVLNYDDPSIRNLASYAKAPIWWVSAQPVDAELRRHIANGGGAATLDLTKDQTSSIAIHAPGADRVESSLSDPIAAPSKSDISATELFLTSIYFADLVY